MKGEGAPSIYRFDVVAKGVAVYLHPLIPCGFVDEVEKGIDGLPSMNDNHRASRPSRTDSG